MIKQKVLQGFTHTSDIRAEFLSSVPGNIKEQIIINQCIGSRPSFRAEGLMCNCISLDIKTVIQVVVRCCLQVTHRSRLTGRVTVGLQNYGQIFIVGSKEMKPGFSLACFHPQNEEYS